MFKMLEYAEWSFPGDVVMTDRINTWRLKNSVPGNLFGCTNCNFTGRYRYNIPDTCPGCGETTKPVDWIKEKTFEDSNYRDGSVGECCGECDYGKDRGSQYCLHWSKTVLYHKVCDVFKHI